jgi:hypothetical protein
MDLLDFHSIVFVSKQYRSFINFLFNFAGGAYFWGEILFRNGSVKSKNVGSGSTTFVRTGTGTGIILMESCIFSAMLSYGNVIFLFFLLLDSTIPVNF